MLCRDCTDKRCSDIGTEEEPIEMECLSCGGVGCEECTEGRIAIEGCPKLYCREIIPSISLIDLFQKGLPPIAGGTLDQSVWFLEAAKILSSEEAQAKSEPSQ